MPSDMVTDDERRKIAADLRMAAEQGQPYTVPTLACFVRADKVSSIWDRLAILIEPEKITGETIACDREELLYLTKKLDARATDLLKLNYLDHSRQRKSARREHARDLMAVCSRIRELCGVVE